MKHKDLGFINNEPKCLYFDNGYCMFREKCRKQHYLSICKIKNCDKTCENRHPIPSKFKKKCKFQLQNECDFSHDTIASDDPNTPEIKLLKIQLKQFKEDVAK